MICKPGLLKVALELSRPLSTSSAMSHSKFEYTRKFEADDKLLPNAWIVVRIDGKGFHKFSDAHKFAKPNEKAALDLMNKCAVNVMTEFNEILLSYGQSDEYSFVFRCSNFTCSICVIQCSRQT